MSELTTEEMDDINILLSEVAFELLGNKFYDIYGVQHETLQQLMTSEKTTAPEGYIEKTCPLLEAVTADISDDEPEHQFEVPALKPGKRNSSCICHRCLRKTDSHGDYHDQRSRIIAYANGERKERRCRPH